MKTLNTFLILSLTAFAISCSSITVQYDYDTKSDFASLHAYDWLPVLEKAGIDTLTEGRIKRAVNTQLEAKGLEMTSDNPEFLIAMHVGHEQKINVQEWGYAYAPRGRYWGGYWGPGGVDVHQYTEGTLILDFVEPKTKHLIWRGVAKAPIDSVTTPEKREKLINEAVQKIFKKFPPAPSK
ncbi:MAG: DUF4136 domain-containing protein [Planctomycetota bacterium]|jgi:hypothetical protein